MQWTPKKVIACLKCIIHKEMLPNIDDGELQKFQTQCFMTDDAIKGLLQLLYDKSEKKLEFYGSVEEVLNDLKSASRAPLLTKFSEIVNFEIGFEYILTEPRMTFVDLKSINFISKHHMLFAFHRFANALSLPQYALQFVQFWLLLFMAQKYRDLRGSYELMPFSVFETILEQLATEYSLFVDSPSVIVESHFDSLGKYFDDDPAGFFIQLKQDLSRRIKDLSHEQELQFLKETYDAIVKTIDTIKCVFEKNLQVFSPFSLEDLPDQQTATFRLFEDQIGEFVLAKEFYTAVRIALTRRSPEEDRQGMIDIETKEERKQGFVICLSESKIDVVMKRMGLTRDDFNIVPYKVLLTNQFTLPITSSYGTHCKSSETALRDVLTYLSSIMKLFQTDNEDNLNKIFAWIDDNLADLFFHRKCAVYVETWKIEEKMDKAWRDLSSYQPQNAYKVPKKMSYTKNDIIEIVRHTIKPSCFNATCYDFALTCRRVKENTTNFPFKVIPFLEEVALNMLIAERCPKIKNLLSIHNELRQFSPVTFKMYTQSTEGSRRPNKKKVSTPKKKSPENSAEKKEKEEIAESFQQAWKEGDLIHVMLKDAFEAIKKGQKSSDNVEMLRKELEESRKRVSLLEEANKTKDEQITKLEKNVVKMSKSLQSQEKETMRLLEENIKLVEKEEKRVDERIWKFKESEVSEKALKELENANKVLEDAQKKSLKQIANYQEEISNLTGNLKNQAGELKRHQDELDLKNEENQILTSNLEKYKIKLESMQIIGQLKTKQDEFGMVSEMKDEKLKNSRKYDQLEEWLSQGLDIIQRAREPENEIHKRLDKYVKIMCIDYDAVLESMSENLNSLAKVYPDRSDIQEVKNQIPQVKDNYGIFLQKIGDQIQQIRQNPTIPIEQLGDEVEPFSSQQLVEMYEKVVEKDNE